MFKAVSHLTIKKTFDLRIVETLDESDGYPVVHVNDKLQGLPDKASAHVLHKTQPTKGDIAAVDIVSTGD